MQTQKKQSRLSARVTALLIALSCLGASLAGCATFSTAAAPDVSLACNTYGKQNTYDTTRDTKETVRGIQVKKDAFGRIGCDLVNGGVK